MSLRVEQLPEMRVAYIHHTGPLHQIVDVFSLLMEWAALAGVDVAEEQVLVVASDDPDLEPGKQTRYDAAITVKDDVEGTAVVGIETVGGGDYAVVEQRGTYDGISSAFAAARDEARAQGRDIEAGPAIVFLEGQEGVGGDAVVTVLAYVPLGGESA